MFKEVGYEEIILNGRATAGRPYQSNPGPAHQPPGTRSEIVPYYLDVEKIAICHQYLLPDGGFGASGKPDPKLVSYGGIVMYCHSQPCVCQVCSNTPEDWRKALEDARISSLADPLDD